MTYFILIISFIVWYRKNKSLSKRISSCERELLTLQEKFSEKMTPREGSDSNNDSANLRNSVVASPSVHNEEIQQNSKAFLVEKDLFANSDSAIVPSPPPIPKDKEEIQERPEAALVENNSAQEASQ